MNLTPKDGKIVCEQSLPRPIRPKEHLIVELALMHKYEIITVLSVSKHACPIFTQKKPNGKLRLLVGLRKINNLIADDYSSYKHPLNTLSDAAQHLEEKSIFWKVEWSQAYQCLQVADQRSVEMLAYNFCNGTLAYTRLVQCSSRSVSAFKASLGPTYQDWPTCGQDVDDIGFAASKDTDPTGNIRAVFDCIRTAGLKLTAKSAIWSHKSWVRREDQ